jgi:arsenate reductase
MAEALLRARHGDRFEAFSAGTEASSVHPLAIEAMAELGIDLSQQQSKTLEAFDGDRFDYAVTVCDQAREACPFFAGAAQHLHWSLTDPSQAVGSHEERLAVFRAVRDEIARRLAETFGGVRA